eukprot:Em0015g183a
MFNSTANVIAAVAPVSHTEVKETLTTQVKLVKLLFYLEKAFPGHAQPVFVFCEDHLSSFYAVDRGVVLIRTKDPAQCHLQ